MLPVAPTTRTVICVLLMLHRSRSERDHDLDGLAIVHRAIAVGNAVEIRHAVEHAAGLDAPSSTSGRSSSMYARTGAGPPPIGDVLEECLQRPRDRLVLRHADPTNGAARARDARAP